MGAFAFAAGVAVLDELRFEERFDHANQRVVDDTIPKRRGGHAAKLGFVDVKIGVRAGIP